MVARIAVAASEKEWGMMLDESLTAFLRGRRMRLPYAKRAEIALGAKCSCRIIRD